MAINQAQTNKTEITMAFGWRKKWILYVNYSTKYFILTYGMKPVGVHQVKVRGHSVQKQKCSNMPNFMNIYWLFDLKKK